MEAEGFTVTGWVGFDTLFVFQPFSFRFDFSTGMTLSSGGTRIAGITIDGHLSGPSPFHAWGSGSVSVLIVDVSVPFDAIFGARTSAPELPPDDPWPPLAAAIALGDNWTTAGPSAYARVDARPPAVSLGPELYAAASTDTLQVRPDIAAGVTKGEAVLAVRHTATASAEAVQVVPVHELEPSG